MPFRPQLAAATEALDSKILEQQIRSLSWGNGMYISPKIDGMRNAVHLDGLHGAVALSRTNKMIPNKFLARELAHPFLIGFDGELAFGNGENARLFEVLSAVRSEDGCPTDINFHVFDVHNKPNWTYAQRYEYLQERIDNLPDDLKCWVRAVPHKRIYSVDEAFEFEGQALEAGFEGAMLNDPLTFYKNGRSTLKQQALVKIKRFVQAEGKIVGWEPLMENQNEAVLDNLGYTKRSSAKAGKVATDMLGKFLLEGLTEPYVGVKCKVGSGMDDEQRRRFWRERESMIGRVVTFKYQAYGSVDAPRTLIFLGFRT